VKSILISLHCESNTGFAIAPLELTFYQMAMELCGNDPARIHFAYPSMKRGPTSTLPTNFHNYLILDPRTSATADFRRAISYLQANQIDTIFGFDHPVSLPIYRHYRRAGVRTFVSYWGAPMSAHNNSIRLAIKRLEVLLRRDGPDHYIFESQGMADAAVFGRGVPPERTSVVPVGVDTNRFRPDSTQKDRVHDILGIPQDRKIFIYSGHMEPRKGVAVIMQAANLLARDRKAADWHIALFGNRDDDHLPHWNMLGPEARSHVTFFGYRTGLEILQRGSFAAIVASTGWDSFPRSALEAQASGLPLLVSNLPGLNETVEDGMTGFIFPPGDSRALCDAMSRLLADTPLRNQIGEQARERAVKKYSLDTQLRNLVSTVTRALR